jgi:hypothetical protein
MRQWRSLAFVVCLVACAKTQPPPAPVPKPKAAPKVEVADPALGLSRPPSPQEMQLIRALMRDTERIRGLGFRAPIDIRIQDRTAMRAYVSSALDEDSLTRARRRYVALGLLDPAVDVRDLLESVMEEELVGYYDPKKKQLAVRDDVARSLGNDLSRPLPKDGTASSSLEWRATVVHELVHALQDQHLGLGTAMVAERTTDADDAFGALVEGDATLAMLGYAADITGVSLETLTGDPRGLAASLHMSPERLSGALRAAPAIVREPLLFRYREGTLFAAKLFAAGGWEQVDAAHLTPPESTVAIVEPGRYLSQDVTPRLSLPELSWLAGSDYERVDEDVLGGFELAVVLGDARIDRRFLQRSWRGDRYIVLARGDKHATAWYLCVDTKALAKRVGSAFEALGTHGIPRRVWVEATCLLVARGFAGDEAEELERRFRTWARREP